jgi:hypothetical protein
MRRMRVVLSHYKSKMWRVHEDLTVTLSNGELLVIPKGFITDLSSVPKPLWSIFPPFGDFLLASLVHDYLYVVRYKNNRKFADKEMLKISMKLHNSSRLKILDNKLRYLAVRLFGWVYWNYIDSQKK